MVAVRRIKSELRQILANPNETWTAEPRGDEDLFEWVCTIKGPKGSSYEGGVFYIDMLIPQSYPFHPPKVRFVTPIYHPCINNYGAICFDILDHNWSPAITIAKLLAQLSHLLAYPGLYYDHIFLEASKMYKENESLFYRTCREWVQKYAIEHQ